MRAQARLKRKCATNTSHPNPLAPHFVKIQPHGKIICNICTSFLAKNTTARSKITRGESNQTVILWSAPVSIFQNVPQPPDQENLSLLPSCARLTWQLHAPWELSAFFWCFVPNTLLQHTLEKHTAPALALCITYSCVCRPGAFARVKHTASNLTSCFIRVTSCVCVSYCKSEKPTHAFN